MARLGPGHERGGPLGTAVIVSLDGWIRFGHPAQRRRQRPAMGG
jgi:hypothetical protein